MSMRMSGTPFHLSLAARGELISRATNRLICVEQSTRDELVILHERPGQVGLGFQMIGKPLREVADAMGSIVD